MKKEAYEQLSHHTLWPLASVWPAASNPGMTQLHGDSCSLQHTHMRIHLDMTVCMLECRNT